MHRLDRRQILRHDGLQRSAALVDVANDAADYAHIGVRIDENLDIAEVAQLLVLKDQDTLHDDDLGGLNPHRLIDPVMYRKIVDQSFDTLARRQTAYMLDHQIRIKRVRVVVIQLFSFLKRDFIVLLIIKIVAQHGDFIAEFLFDFLDQGAFAGACAACNPDDNDIFHNASPLSCCDMAPPYSCARYLYAYMTHLLCRLLGQRSLISVLRRNRRAEVDRSLFELQYHIVDFLQSDR